MSLRSYTIFWLKRGCVLCGPPFFSSSARCWKLIGKTFLGKFSYERKLSARASQEPIAINSCVLTNERKGAQVPSFFSSVFCCSSLFFPFSSLVLGFGFLGFPRLPYIFDSILPCMAILNYINQLLFQEGPKIVRVLRRLGGLQPGNVFFF